MAPTLTVAPLTSSRARPSPAPFDALWHAARAAWPDVPLDHDDFAHHVARHSSSSPPALDCAADLYLACACARGERRALAALDPMLVAAATRAAQRIDGSRAFADQVAQDLRAQLLVGREPKIAAYAGRASLASWLRVVAKRAALAHRRAKRDQPHDEVPSDLGASGAADFDLLRAKYRPAFEDAVRLALATLAPEDRDYLRLALRDGKTVEEIAALRGASRATAARRVAAARARLVEDSRRILRERLRLSSSELTSLAGLVGSGLHVSIVRLLGDT